MNSKLKESYPFFTIGHSTRQINDFINILKANKIKLLVDVRSIPGSNRSPEYNSETLKETLKLNNIKYIHIKKLGGLRKQSYEVLPNTNSFWKNKSFRNYADYAMTNEFNEGLKHLMELGYKYRLAIMCVETLWWKCHRRIITDYLLLNNKEVFHIFNLNNIQMANKTPSAKLLKSGSVVYN